MKKTRGTLLQIAQLGVPIVRKKALAVKSINESLKQLIDDMITTVKEVDGVGIAAPQVYHGLRVFILASHPSPRYPKAPKMKPTAIINPKIVKRSENLEKDWEGCLSIPGIRGFVPRHTSLIVEYMNVNGSKKKKELKGFLARIFQHEFDHLEGKVFLDCLSSTKDIITEWVYQKKMRNKFSA